jgi:hypothetical protein
MLMLEIITRKYPKNLQQVYRQLLSDRPMIQGSPVLDAISVSSLPIEQKRTLFLLGTKHENPERCREALKYLKKLEPE